MTRPPGSESGSSPTHASRDRLIFVTTAFAVVLLDQVTKALVISRLPIGGRWPGPDSALSRYFTFTHVSNTGVAFGMFQGKSDVLLLVSLVVIGALLWYRRQAPEGAVWLNVALGLQVGGAIGNLIDRVRIGHVTDFIDFQFWPVFNVADSAIFLGVVVLGYHMLLEERAARARDVERDGPGMALSTAIEDPPE